MKTLSVSLVAGASAHLYVKLCDEQVHGAGVHCPVSVAGGKKSVLVNGIMEDDQQITLGNTYDALLTKYGLVGKPQEEVDQFLAALEGGEAKDWQSILNATELVSEDGKEIRAFQDVIPMAGYTPAEIKDVIRYMEAYAVEHASDATKPADIEKPLTKDPVETADAWQSAFVQEWTAAKSNELDHIRWTKRNDLFKRLAAANFMHVEPLLQLYSAKLAWLAKGLDRPEMRFFFGEVYDFSKEEWLAELQSQGYNVDDLEEKDTHMYQVKRQNYLWNVDRNDLNVDETLIEEPASEGGKKLQKALMVAAEKLRKAEEKAAKDEKANAPVVNLLQQPKSDVNLQQPKSDEENQIIS